MGNSEAGHSRTPAHAGSGVDTTPRRPKLHKVKKLQIPPPHGTTVFYNTDDTGDDRYHTCKPDVGTHSNVPSYYLTASQLHKSKSRSISQDAGLNTISADGLKPDVRHVAWSPLTRKSETDSVSMIYLLVLHWVLSCSKDGWHGVYVQGCLQVTFVTKQYKFVLAKRQ